MVLSLTAELESNIETGRQGNKHKFKNRRGLATRLLPWLPMLYNVVSKVGDRLSPSEIKMKASRWIGGRLVHHAHRSMLNNCKNEGLTQISACLYFVFKIKRMTYNCQGWASLSKPRKL